MTNVQNGPYVMNCDKYRILFSGNYFTITSIKHDISKKGRARMVTSLTKKRGF
jgi:hypothetical protein